MGVFQELVKVYDDHEKEVGTMDNQGHTLLPIAHASVNVDLEVTITKDSKFSNAMPLEKKERLTVIPITIESANRSSGLAAAPLHDKIKYVAGDYVDFAPENKKKKATEGYDMYMAQLNQWISDAEIPPVIGTIATYLKKGQLIKDILTKITDKKIVDNIKLGSAFIRFKVYDPEIPEMLPPWKNKEIFKAWENYYVNKIEKELPEKLDYITGKNEVATGFIEANIVPRLNKAKLISANDDKGYTYRGTFLEKEYASIGYISSQKAMHALKWLLQRQGISEGTRSFLFWKSDFDKNKILQENMVGLLGGYLGSAVKNETPNSSSELDSNATKQYKLGIRGQSTDLKDSQPVNILFLDAATSGRLSIIYYDLMQSDELYKNLLSWQKSASFKITQQKELVVKTISLKNIVAAAYRIGQGGSRYETVAKQAITRLTTRVIDGQNIPDDILKAIANRIRRPMSYIGAMGSGLKNWRYDLRTYCAALNYNNRGEIGMSLDPKNNERSYLFGRMLAIADSMEEMAIRNQNKKGSEISDRLTTAMRFYSNFVERPTTTWHRIYQSIVRSYMKKLGKSANYFFEQKLIAINKMTPEDMWTDQPLNGLVYSGYMSQKNENYTKKGGNDHE